MRVGVRARLVFRAGVEFLGVFGEACHVVCCPQLRDQPGRMPSRPARKLFAFQQNNILPSYHQQ